MFREGSPRRELKTFIFFEENQACDSEIKYLGLNLDRKFTFRSHIKYSTIKFWAKDYLLIPLGGRSSPLSLNNKLIIFKQVFSPILTYAAQICGMPTKTNRKKFETLQNKLLRIITTAPWFIKNKVLYHDLKIPLVEKYIKELPGNIFKKIKNHPTILQPLQLIRKNGKYPFPYATMKWSMPFKTL
ncbi:RNA-directed DNA polymerase from mobile element jockey [Araneus ventricosus]|uniref:RNA-directed DNA polymerase from mobile element jockey n=1 Tax=Araneus ventricosus TaxID=182803 RepID=A0A4Y2H9D8_ARAVE|nr:RNA-directed DNA polymerase from mobile element jockey [Araneus ventricosus]